MAKTELSGTPAITAASWKLALSDAQLNRKPKLNCNWLAISRALHYKANQCTSKTNFIYAATRAQNNGKYQPTELCTCQMRVAKHQVSKSHRECEQAWSQENKITHQLRHKSQLHGSDPMDRDTEGVLSEDFPQPFVKHAGKRPISVITCGADRVRSNKLEKHLIWTKGLNSLN